MGKLQDILSKIKGNKSEFKEQLKEAQMQDKIQTTINERKKSSNLRELEKVMRDRDEERIKSALDKIHKQQNSETWKSKNLILAQKATILNNDRPILKEKNIFMGGHQIPFMHRGGMFFK